MTHANAALACSGERFTWADYLTWPENERWELIDGEAVAMSPSPSSFHQDATAGLLVAMKNYFAGRKCRVYPAPMDVKLSDVDVVQPDILVVCNPEQIKNHIEGPPALVVEILSRSSLQRDRITKTEMYARYGIEEYWIVTPDPGLVEVYKLQDGHYLLWKAFGPKDTLTSPGFPGLSIGLPEVFDYPMSGEPQDITLVKERPGVYAANRPTA